MRNPCEGVKLPSEPIPDMRFLDPSQVTELVAVQLPYYRPLVWTASYVGLRWGELAGLKDREGRPAAEDDHNRPAARKFVDILAEHFATDRVKESGMAFPTKTGKLLRASNYRRRWKKTLDGVLRASLEDGGPPWASSG